MSAPVVLIGLAGFFALVFFLGYVFLDWTDFWWSDEYRDDD